MGGAQAIAALALGTERFRGSTRSWVPGGVYVAAAKRLVYGETGIDMVAGPSEVLIIADGSSPVEWMACDLFSQAEHDEAAQALLICPDGDYLDRVHGAMARLLRGHPAKRDHQRRWRARGSDRDQQPR